MADDNNKQNTSSNENLALDDERRVKVLSPSMLVFKRFIRNRLAIVGTVFIALMFLFSFVGGIVSPYGESEVFRGNDSLVKDYAGVIHNSELRYTDNKENPLSSIAKAKFVMAKNKNEEAFECDGETYTIEKLSDDAFAVADASGTVRTVASTAIYDVVSSSTVITSGFRYVSEKAIAASEKEFEAEDGKYTVSYDDENVIICGPDGSEYVYISEYIVNPIASDGFISVEDKKAIINAIEDGKTELTIGETVYKIERQNLQWAVKTATVTQVIRMYEFPSKEHPLGTDGNGMDILTRLMYGGRVSLLIGFIVVFVETFIGVILGGISGYFGGFIDNLIMRIVDIFNCIPSTPLIIILGAMMDALKIDPKVRMIYLMLILGFLGWPGVARLVRGQILSLREQEFMTATEATGLSVSRRIFKHLIPNVIPQLIVICTMGLGSVILTESTLSFLGLGVKYPFASWGNIINAVSNVYVMTNYWFVWIPAGFCILITVLGFNFVGDGLRDAFDPKMKR